MTRLNKQEFLDWAYDDLFTNTTRGVLAEYIVATALGITKTKRREWDQYDLQFGDVGVEVKSAAYVQAWKQARPSKITFSIRPARGWDPVSETFADSAERSAAVYVFCLLEGKDKSRIAPLDMAHWTFYVLATSELDRLVPGRKSIGLDPLRRLGARECKYDDLKDAIYEAAGIKPRS
ncbi:MAG: hypothetical protein R2763_01405 [Mycobacterium sp.]